MKRPITTLFMLMSVDGKISTGDNDSMDVDKDFPQIKGVKEGLWQYYNIEKTTDRCSLNTGRVMEKIGANTDKFPLDCPDMSFIIIDNKPHLDDVGVRNLIEKTKELYLVTTNNSHPIFSHKENPKVKIIHYPDQINFVDLFEKFKSEFNIDKITIQCGGTLNSILIRAGLVDKVLLVVAPALIGGKNTSTIMDGESLHNTEELARIKSLEFIRAEKLKDSYLLLEYKVNNNL